MPPDTCQCVVGPVNADGGCPTCHLLVLTVADDRERIDYLRARGREFRFPGRWRWRLA